MRLLIEEFLPVREISEEAKKEKLGRPPTFEMHYWWARKPLITARATVLGALLSKDGVPEDKNNKTGGLPYRIRKLLNLYDLYIKKGPRAHTLDPSISILKKAYEKSWGTSTPVVLDPFAGGGSIPFEALRLGCSAVAVDYNPVAYLILKATLEYPKRYGRKLYEDVERYAWQVFNELKEEMAEFYPTHNGKDVAAYIFSWVVKCPHCGFETPLVGSWWLARTKRGKRVYLSYRVEDGELKLEVKSGDDAPEGNVGNRKWVCLSCNSEIKYKDVVEDIRKNQKEKLLAVVLLGEGNKKTGKDYDVPNEEDVEALNKAASYLKKNWFKFYKEGLIPDEEMPDDNRYAKYLPKWYQLFNPRQLLLMVKYAEKVKNLVEEIAEEDEDYAKAVGSYLSFILAKHIDRNCRGTSWDSSYEKIADMFRQRRISMMWDHTEVNPFVKSSGTLVGNINNVLDALNYAIQKLQKTPGTVEVLNESTASWKPERKFKIIVTDPPYYDDIPYGEVSEVFYVWYKRILGRLFEKEAKYFRSSKIDTREELDVGGNRDKEFFNKLFLKTMQNVRELLDDDGILVLFFAHKNPEAWYFVLDALRSSGFKITATFPLHTESTESVVARGKKSVYHSLIISARKRTQDKEGFLEDIIPEIERHILERASQLEGYGLRGSDLLVASIGVALEHLTEYSELKSYSGSVTAENAIDIAQSVLAKYIAMKHLGTEADPTTTFYITSRLSGMDTMDYDTANQLIKSLGLDEEALEADRLIKVEKTKGRKVVKLQDYYRGDTSLEIAGEDTIKGTALIDYVHKAMRAYEKEGLKGFNSAVKDSPYPRRSIVAALKVLAEIRKDPSRQNDREAVKAEEIYQHLKNLGLDAW